LSIKETPELLDTITREQVDQTFVRCPDIAKSQEMEKVSYCKGRKKERKTPLPFLPSLKFELMLIPLFS